MRIIHEDARTRWEADNDDEAAALRHVKEHVPLFAGTEGYGVAAFLAGVQWERDRAKGAGE